MNRRSFVRAAGLSALAAHLAPESVRAVGDPEPPAGPAPTMRRGSRPNSDPDALIMDAMGELRTVYDPPLVREMLASGMDSITVTLCDPKPTGREALELAVDSLLEYDRYLEAHPDLFVKATSVADVDEARRSGRMATDRDTEWRPARRTRGSASSGAA